MTNNDSFSEFAKDLASRQKDIAKYIAQMSDAMEKIADTETVVTKGKDFRDGFLYAVGAIRAISTFTDMMVPTVSKLSSEDEALDLIHKMRKLEAANNKLTGVK